jgi:hypothetical protein
MVPSSTQLSDIQAPFNPDRKNDVFISYSRKDKDFVEKLVASFQQVDRDPWVDWEDIPKGEDWWKSIQQGIEAAHTFIFVVSPDSVKSAVCGDEVNYAAKLNKRFLPLVCREGFDMAHVHPSISQHNWIFARETDDFHAAFQELLKALDTDLDYVRAHTRLLVRSLEWQNCGENSCYLLRGSDLDDAQQWLNQGSNKQPRPTEGQVAYLNASLAARTAALKARQKAKWIVVLTTVIANLFFVAGGLYYIYSCVNMIAESHVEKSMRATLKGALEGIDGDDFAKLAELRFPPEQAEPVNNPSYEKHQAWLKTVNQVVPAAVPTTYIRKPNGNILAIGDVSRIINQKVAHPYRMTLPSGEVLPMGLKGFQRVSVNLNPYKDSSGKSWVSIYGPIRDSSGEVVGILGLAYDSSYWTDIEDHIREVMTIACTAALIWLTVSSWLILKATRPSSEISGKVRKLNCDVETT